MPKEYKLMWILKEERSTKKASSKLCKAIITIIKNDPFMYVWCAT
jgi:hypothetical protein